MAFVLLTGILPNGPARMPLQTNLRPPCPPHLSHDGLAALVTPDRVGGEAVPELNSKTLGYFTPTSYGVPVEPRASLRLKEAARLPLAYAERL
jgi:hypothetical protein